MIVKYKVTNDPDVRHPTDNPLVKVADKVFGRIQTALSLPYLFYPSTPLLKNHDWVRQADIIQLFNLHGNYFAHPFVRYVAAKRSRSSGGFRTSGRSPATAAIPTIANGGGRAAASARSSMNIRR